MNVVQSVWEDEDNNRKIEMNIEYVISNDKVEISGVAPTRVSFLNSESNEEIRSIGVWTRAGSEMLISQWESCPAGKTAAIAKIASETLAAAV